MAKPHIFISYRRADSQAFSGRIYDRLVQSFGAAQIFKDVDRIPPGTSFSQVLEQALDQADILLVIVGEQWLNITGKDGRRRLDDPEDWVRQEVERGLQRNDVKVIPVFIGSAAIPDAANLPESLRELLTYQVVRVREDPDFHRDMDRLIKWLAPQKRPWRVGGGIAAAIVLALLVAAGVFFSRYKDTTLTVTESSVTQDATDILLPPSNTPDTITATDVPATPTPQAETGIAVTNTKAGERVRDTPNGAIIGEVTAGEMLAVLSGAENIGKSDPVQIRTASGLEGWMAGTHLIIARPEMALGVTLNQSYDEKRFPSPESLGKITWVRLLYNVSYNPDTGTYGNTDLERARRYYEPYLKRYADAGYKVMLILNHQTYGEGQGDKYGNWASVTDDTWFAYTTQFAIVAREIANDYKGVVSAYQIWNEPDTPANIAVSAIPMNAKSYADLLAEAVRAIHRADPDALVLTGGLISGPVQGSTFIDEMLKALPEDARPDGIAIHLYGYGATGGAYADFGSITTALEAYAEAAGDYPLWVTEWGVLARQLDPPEAVADYARDFIDALNNISVPVQAAIWYSMGGGDSSYGLVDADGKPQSPLYEVFTGG